jgi:hypothetical protein
MIDSTNSPGDQDSSFWGLALARTGKRKAEWRDRLSMAGVQSTECFHSGFGLSQDAGGTVIF